MDQPTASAAGENSAHRGALSDAVFLLVHERGRDAKSLANALRAMGFADCDKSTVNSILHRLERQGAVRKAEAHPPVWLAGRPSQAADASPRATASGAGARFQQRIWDEAMALLRGGNSEDASRLLHGISLSTGLPGGYVRAVLLQGHDGVVVTDGRLRLTRSSLLRSRLVTPAGNPRSGPVIVTAASAELGLAPFEIRALMLDSPDPFWVCAKVQVRSFWERLFPKAETLSQTWSLPLRPAPRVSPGLPAALIWRRRTVDAAVAQVEAVFASLPGMSYDAAQIQDSPQEIHKTHNESEVQRLLRRRGPVPRGHGHPAAGFCDYCGHPLSDPYSLLVGVGPVCRAHYRPEVIAKVAATASSSPEFRELISEVEAVHHLRAAWREADQVLRH
jgi:hypothetical protein